MATAVAHATGWRCPACTPCSFLPAYRCWQDLSATVSETSHRSLEQDAPKAGGDIIKPRPIIGRFGTSLKSSIVGLPNVGKSTSFNVCTDQYSGFSSKRPFGTADQNESRDLVPDERLDFLCEDNRPASKIPAFLNAGGSAGLVDKAWKMSSYLILVPGWSLSSNTSFRRC